MYNDILQYLKTLNEKDKKHIIKLYTMYPVKDFKFERLKLIQNGKKRYPNGFILDENNEVDIFRVDYDFNQ